MTTLMRSLLNEQYGKMVHDDVSLLSDHGLLLIIDEDHSKQPYVPYERIQLDLELAGLSVDKGLTLI